MAAAFSLVVSRFVVDELEQRYGNIGALLVDESGNLLAWALNTKDQNSTCHAEVNLLQSFFYRHRQPVPPKCTVYTTLKPCRMCAGMISHATDQRVAVVYGQDDRGPDATGTSVDKAGVANLLGDPDYDSEPIMIESDFGGRAAVMAYRLDRQRRQYRGGGGIVDALASEQVTLTMVDALGALERIRLATEDDFDRAVERRVVEHLWPFLRSNRATLDTIPG
ncbi:MAG: Bd3614 family nucleic acid deaminase [Acidobacteriota bacterium]